MEHLVRVAIIEQLLEERAALVLAVDEHRRCLDNTCCGAFQQWWRCGVERYAAVGSSKVLLYRYCFALVTGHCRATVLEVHAGSCMMVFRQAARFFAVLYTLKLDGKNG